MAKKIKKQWRKFIIKVSTTILTLFGMISYSFSCAYGPLMSAYGIIGQVRDLSTDAPVAGIVVSLYKNGIQTSMDNSDTLDGEVYFYIPEYSVAETWTIQTFDPDPFSDGNYFPVDVTLDLSSLNEFNTDITVDIPIRRID